MDVTALIVFVGGFAVCAALVFMVSFFGVKEQTFEEALAQQRKKNEKEKNKAKDKKKDATKTKNKKWNKKKESDDRSAEVNVDELTEEEPVIVESLEDIPLLEETPVQVIEEVLTPEPSPQPSSELKETKQAKKIKNKSKLEIQDITEELVEEVSESIVEEEVVIEPVTLELVEEAVVAAQEVKETPKPDPIKAENPEPTPIVSKKVGKKQGQAGKHGSKDLLSIVEKTVLNDFEAQQIIDVLLNKQTGNFTSGADEWVEQGKLSETAKLQKQIAELEKAMDEEVSKGKSFKDKMTELRRELNEEKSAKAATTRMVEELNKSRTQETNNMNNKLQQVQYDMTIIQTQLNQQVQHNHQMELDQTHYLATIETLNAQLKNASDAAMNASASAANDQQILSELDMLRGLRSKYEVSLKEYATENASLKEQLAGKGEDVAIIQKQLGQVTATQNQLNSEVARLQSENSRLTNAEEEHAKIIVENGKEHARVIMEKKEEHARMIMENERLSEQLASSVERPETEGQADEHVNGHIEESAEENEKGILGLKEKLLMANDENDKIRSDLEEKLKIVQKELKEKSDQCDSVKATHDEDVKIVEGKKIKIKELETQIGNFQSTIEELKAKNDTLRTKNWKAMEALSSSEQKYTKLLNQKAPPPADSSDDKIIALVNRLFPTIEGTDTVDQVEVAAKKEIDALKKNAPTEDQQKLESQVTHYKTVLAQTESMLTALQSSVEAEEGQWRSKLDVANKELNDMKMQVSSLNGPTGEYK